MTEFVHKPYDKIYVRDMIKLSLDDLIGMMSSLEAANAYWVDGVLFASFAMTESEELAKKEMQNVTADSEKLLKEARAEREGMLKEAREIKDKLIAESKELAKIEGDKMIMQAQASIESEKKAAVADIKNQVAELSVDIAEKVIKEQLSNKDKQLKLVDDMLGDIKLN